MPESVADKTPMPITIERRHIDPPGLWIAIVIGSVALHSLLLWLMLSSKLNIVGRSSRAGARPLQVVEVVPRATIRTKPRIIAQKPKLQSTKPIQVKSTPVQPPQKQVSQPGTIAFTNKVTIKKPVNKSPLDKKTVLTPPTPKIEPKKLNPKPKPDPKLAEIRRLQQLAEIRRLQQEAERRRLSKLAEQQRQKEIAEIRRLQQLTEQQRQQQEAEIRLEQEAERQRQQKLTEQQRQKEIASQLRQQEAERQLQQKLTEQRQKEIAEQQRQQKLAEQLRQEEIDAERRKREVATNQLPVPLSTPIEVPGNAPAPPTETPTPTPTQTSTPKPIFTPTSTPTSQPKPTSIPATTTAGNSESQGGFWIASSLPVDDEAQNVLNNKGGVDQLVVPPRLIDTAKTPKKLPVLDEKDKKLLTKSQRCLVQLFINNKGEIDKPGEGASGIKATGSSETGDLCQRYAEQYFKLNKGNIRFEPGKDVDGIATPGYMLRYIEIKSAAPDKKNPS